MQYQDPNFGYTISYPVGSQIEHRAHGAITIHMSRSGGSALVDVYDNSKQRSMNEYSQIVIQTFQKSLNGFKISYKGVSSLSGIQSRYIIFTFYR